MGEMTTNRLWDNSTHAVPQDCPSQYARMIPGSCAVGRLKDTYTTAPLTAPLATAGGASEEIIARHKQPRTAIQQLVPHPAGDRFALYQMVAFDFMVLAMVWSAASVFFSGRGLPWEYLPVFATLVTLFSFSEGLYRNDGEPCPAGIVSILVRATLFAMALVFLAGKEAIHPFAAGTMCVGSVAGLMLSHRLRQLAWQRRQHEAGLRKTLIVGAGPIGRSIAQALRNDPIHRATVCGFVDDDLPLSPVVLGRIADLEWLARAEFIDEVILAIPGQAVRTREAAEIAYRNHLDIRAVPDLPPGPWSDAEVSRIGEIPVVTLHHEPVPGAALFLKRLLDVAGSVFGLVLISPVMAVVSVLIWLDSPGPILYSAKRTGVKGRPFPCHKFRSMVTNAEHLKEELRSRNQRQGPIFKIDDDPRVTRIGRFIRRYSLDELPQLWNVLRGEMSLVGPRPHPIDEVNHYELQHYRRLDMKPGITGLWQITARDCPSFELNMHLDLTYIETWTLLLDLRILAGTVRVLFSPEGA